MAFYLGNVGLVLVHHLQFGFFQKCRHLCANCRFIRPVAQVTGYLAKHIFVAGFFQIRYDHGFRIFVGVVARKTHQIGGPKAKQFVASGTCSELHFGIMGAYSGVIRPVIPITSGQPFRFDPAGDSGLSGHPKFT